MRVEALLELQNPHIDEESVMFGFTGSFYVIIILYRPCIFHLASPPTSLTIPKQQDNNNNKKTKETRTEKKQQEQVTKKFSE